MIPQPTPAVPDPPTMITRTCAALELGADEVARLSTAEIGPHNEVPPEVRTEHLGILTQEWSHVYHSEDTEVLGVQLADNGATARFSAATAARAAELCADLVRALALRVADADAASAEFLRGQHRASQRGLEDAERVLAQYLRENGSDEARAALMRTLMARRERAWGRARERMEVTLTEVATQNVEAERLARDVAQRRAVVERTREPAVLAWAVGQERCHSVEDSDVCPLR